MAGDEGINGVLDVESVWERVEPDLKRACEYSYDGITTDLLKKWLLEREAQLWLVDGGVLVTRIIVYPHLKALQILSCAGKGMTSSVIQQTVLTLENYARHYGCSRLEAIGRKGWLRVLKKSKVAALVITKELV